MKKGRWGLTIYVLCVILLLVLAGSQLASFLNIWTHRGSSETQEYSGGLTQETDQLAGILRPLRMYVSSGENEGRCSLVSDRTGHYGGLYKDSWQFLCSILQNAANIKMIGTDEAAVNSAACRYTYGVALTAEMLRDQTGWAFSSEFAFHEIVLAPAQNVKEKACLYLVNEDTQKIMQIVSEKIQWQSEENVRLLERMKTVCNALGENYLITQQVFAGCFRRSLYLRDQNAPETIGYWSLWPALQEWSQEACREEAGHFFEYPELIRSESYQPDAWIFTDDRCTVRIKQNGVIDYVKTPTAQEEAPLSAAGAYEIAWAFLQEDLRDSVQSPGTYLAEVAETSTGYCFYFNYKVNDREVLPDETLFNQEGLKAAVEIEIQNHEVCRYRRLKVVEEQNPYRMRILIDSPIKALDRMIQAVPELKKLQWQDLRMIYRISEGEVELDWQLEAEGKFYYEHVQ